MIHPFFENAGHQISLSKKTVGDYIVGGHLL